MKNYKRLNYLKDFKVVKSLTRTGEERQRTDYVPYIGASSLKGRTPIFGDQYVLLRNGRRKLEPCECEYRVFAPTIALNAALVCLYQRSYYYDSGRMSIFAGRVTAGLSLQPGGIAPVHSGVKRENFRFKQKSLRHGPATYQRLFVATYFFKIPRENLCYR